MPRKKKRPTAHEAAIRLLKKNAEGNLPTVVAIYSLGTKVPAKAIPRLIAAIEEAGRIVAVWQGVSMRALGVEYTVNALRRQFAEVQAEENRQKEKEEAKKKK